MKVEWHRLAVADLANITTFIATEDPAAAERILDVIQRQIDLLSHHPEIGRLGRVPATRERVVLGTPFVVIYRINGDISVLRILHGAQQWPLPSDVDT